MKLHPNPSSNEISKLPNCAGQQKRVRLLTIRLGVIWMKFDISKLYLFLKFQIANSIVYNLLGNSY
jgi:hypothetical protein